jgi:hypothetical protein
MMTNWHQPSSVSEKEYEQKSKFLNNYFNLIKISGNIFCSSFEDIHKIQLFYFKFLKKELILLVFTFFIEKKSYFFLRSAIRGMASVNENRFLYFIIKIFKNFPSYPRFYIKNLESRKQEKICSTKIMTNGHCFYMILMRNLYVRKFFLLRYFCRYFILLTRRNYNKDYEHLALFIRSTCFLCLFSRLYQNVNESFLENFISKTSTMCSREVFGKLPCRENEANQFKMSIKYIINIKGIKKQWALILVNKMKNRKCYKKYYSLDSFFLILWFKNTSFYGKKLIPTFFLNKKADFSSRIKIHSEIQYLFKKKKKKPNRRRPVAVASGNHLIKKDLIVRYLLNFKKNLKFNTFNIALVNRYHCEKGFLINLKIILKKNAQRRLCRSKDFSEKWQFIDKNSKILDKIKEIKRVFIFYFFITEYKFKDVNFLYDLWNIVKLKISLKKY